MSNNTQIKISENIGKVSIEIVECKNPIAVITLAHGAGAGMHHPFMKSLAMALADNGINSVRFNFPYMENKKMRPDPPAIAEKTVEVVVEETHKRFQNLPIFCSGKSFGGRMSSQLLSKRCADYMRGIVFFGFPLHAPGKPSVDRADHLKLVSVPMLFLQGTRDTLAQIDLIKKVTTMLPKATLKIIEQADHSFKVPKQDSIPILAAFTREWIDALIV